MAREDTLTAIRTYCEAWERGDLPAILGCYADDFTTHYFGDNALSGTHTGRAAVVAALQKMLQLANRKLVEVHDYLASDEHAVVLARERFVRGGKAIEVGRVLVYHVKDGKLAECWVYDDDQRAVDEMLSEAG